MQGRPPKPSKIKELEGNPGKRKLNQHEPKPRPVAPKPPAGSLPDVRKFWKRHGPMLDQLGILTEADGAAFEFMAIHYALAKAALDAMIDDQGNLVMTSEDEEGVTRKHPMLPVVRDNSASFRLYSVLFGLNPAARARLVVSEPEDDDDAFFE